MPSYIAPYDLAERILGTEPLPPTPKISSVKSSEKDMAYLSLRKRYEDLKGGKKLGDPLNWYDFPSFGAPDTITRGVQVNLIETFAKLKIKGDAKTSTLLNQTKYKLITAIIYLVQKDIRAKYTLPRPRTQYGDLHTLLDHTQDINASLDDETKIECLITLKNANPGSINPLLDNPLTNTQWEVLKVKATQQLEVLYAKKGQKGPFESALGTGLYFLGRPLGYGTGYVFGRIIGESTIMTPLVKLLELLFRGVFSVTNRRNGGDHGHMASMFFAGKYASDAATYSCGIFGAMVLGGAIANLGQKAGQTAGQGIDFLGDQAVSGAKHLYTLMTDPKNKPVRMGIDVIKGEPVFFNAKNEQIDIGKLIASLEAQIENPETDIQFSPKEEKTVRKFVDYIQAHALMPESLDTEETDLDIADAAYLQLGTTIA
jgi:hypothetical protein